jgi:RNA-binding protein
MRLRGTPGDTGRHDTLRPHPLLTAACMPVILTSAQTRFLRGQAHGLRAILQVGGKGVSPALVAEIDNALEHHELIKLKIAAEDREARDGMIAELAKRTDSALVQRIGHTAILYRPSKDHRQIVLPRG